MSSELQLRRNSNAKRLRICTNLRAGRHRAESGLTLAAATEVGDRSQPASVSCMLNTEHIVAPSAAGSTADILSAGVSPTKLHNTSVARFYFG
jgi:hypothetical protein